MELAVPPLVALTNVRPTAVAVPEVRHTRTVNVAVQSVAPEAVKLVLLPTLAPPVTRSPTGYAAPTVKPDTKTAIVVPPVKSVQTVNVVVPPEPK